jgi:hypothetical protein
MAGLSLQAKAIEQGGVFLAVEVRDTNGVEVSSLEGASFQVWKVDGIGLIKKVTISQVWDVSETFSVTREGKAFSTPGIVALRGLYIVFLDLDLESVRSGATFSVLAQGKKRAGALFPPSGMALASLG